MAWFPKIENKDDFLYLKRFVDTWAAKSKDNVAAYVEYVDMFERLRTAFEEAVQAEEIQVAQEIEKPVRKPRAKKVEKIPILSLCKNHPAYQAKRSPRTDCEGCWSAFEKYAGKSRAKQARLKFDRRNSG